MCSTVIFQAVCQSYACPPSYFLPPWISSLLFHSGLPHFTSHTVEPENKAANNLKIKVPVFQSEYKKDKPIYACKGIASASKLGKIQHGLKKEKEGQLCVSSLVTFLDCFRDNSVDSIWYFLFLLGEQSYYLKTMMILVLPLYNYIFFLCGINEKF